MAGGGPIESEVKLRVTGPQAAREALARLGAAPARARHFEDNLLFDDALGSLRRQGAVLRVRRTPGEAWLTFKGPLQVEQGIKRREELELSVGEPEVLQALLERLGFRRLFRYQKYRESYRYGEVEIVIDETPIGTFIELEGPPEAVHAAAAGLGYARADYLSESYAALFFASGGRGDMVFA